MEQAPPQPNSGRPGTRPTILRMGDTFVILGAAGEALSHRRANCRAAPATRQAASRYLLSRNGAAAIRRGARRYPDQGPRSGVLGLLWPQRDHPALLRPPPRERRGLGIKPFRTHGPHRHVIGDDRTGSERNCTRSRLKSARCALSWPPNRARSLFATASGELIPACRRLQAGRWGGDSRWRPPSRFGSLSLHTSRRMA